MGPVATVDEAPDNTTGATRRSLAFVVVATPVGYIEAVPPEKLVASTAFAVKTPVNSESSAPTYAEVARLNVTAVVPLGWFNEYQSSSWVMPPPVATAASAHVPLVLSVTLVTVSLAPSLVSAARNSASPLSTLIDGRVSDVWRDWPPFALACCTRPVTEAPFGVVALAELDVADTFPELSNAETLYV